MPDAFRHVWVTRPQPGADETAQRLRLLGYAPFVAPLTEIVGLDLPDNSTALEQCTSLIFTSANGVRHFTVRQDLWPRLRALPVFVVGEATAKTARALGFDNVHVGTGDAAALAALVASASSDGFIGYITGRQRTPTLEHTLSQVTRSLVTIEVYETQKVSRITHDMVSFFEIGKRGAIMLYSGLSAEALLDLISSVDIVQSIKKQQFIAISERVSGLLEPYFPNQTIVAETPDEAGMLAALEALSSPSKY